MGGGMKKPKSKLAAARALRPGWSFNKALGLFYRGGRPLASLPGNWAKSPKPASA